MKNLNLLILGQEYEVLQICCY